MPRTPCRRCGRHKRPSTTSRPPWPLPGAPIGTGFCGVSASCRPSSSTAAATRCGRGRRPPSAGGLRSPVSGPIPSQRRVADPAELAHLVAQPDVLLLDGPPLPRCPAVSKVDYLCFSGTPGCLSPYPLLNSDNTTLVVGGRVTAIATTRPTWSVARRGTSTSWQPRTRTADASNWSASSSASGASDQRRRPAPHQDAGSSRGRAPRRS